MALRHSRRGITILLRCKRVHLIPLRIPLMNPPPLFRKSQLRVLRSSLANRTTRKESNDGSRVWGISGPPPATKAGYTLAGRRGGWGVNILEDERNKLGSLKMNTTLEYSTRVVQEGDRRCKKSTLNDSAYLTPLRIPLMNPVIGLSSYRKKFYSVGTTVDIEPEGEGGE
jgi:hypothetical protein